MNIYRDNYTLSDYNLTISVPDAIGTICGADNIKIDKSELDERIQEGQSMTKEKEYIDRLIENAENTGGVVHIPLTPPQATTAEETDKLLNDPERNRLDKYLAIQNESGGYLVPHIIAEIGKLQEQHPERKYNYWEVLESITMQEPEALALLNRAREDLKKENQKQRAADARAKQKKGLSLTNFDATPRVKYNNSETFTFVKDNFTNSVFSIVKEPEIIIEQGKPTIYVTFSDKKKKKKQVVNLKAVFTFDHEYLQSFGIDDPSIDPGYDRAVCTICDNLFFNGNNKVTLSKILKELGIPYSQKEADKLLMTLRKLKSINLVVNNKAVLELYGIGETYREIDGAFLPIRIVDDKLLVNGNIAETTIIILDYSPFWLVGDPIKQKTEFNKKVFALYDGRRTSKYWRVIVYLMSEIAYLHHGGRSSIFLLSSIYEAVGDTDGHQRASTKKLVYELLDKVFKPLGYIDNYTKTDNSFIVSYHKKLKS